MANIDLEAGQEWYPTKYDCQYGQPLLLLNVYTNYDLGLVGGISNVPKFVIGWF